MFGLEDRLKRIKEEYKTARDNPNAEISTVKAKYDQQIQNIKREIRLIDNDYNPLLRELKIANLDSQLINLEKYRDHADFKEKTEDAELFALSMIQTETIRYQDAKISSNSALNPTGWDHVKNFFKRGIGGISENKLSKGYMGMGRGKRMALNAAIIGAGTALWLPASVAAGASAAAFVGYKMARSLMGGTFGYFLSKKVFQPIARKAYEHDSAKTLKAQQEEATTSKEMTHFEELSRGETDPTEREKILGKIADFNIELCAKYSERIRRDKKYFIANNVLGTVVAGVAGGKGAQMTADWLAGPGMLGIFPAHGGMTTDTPENTPHKEGGVIPPETEVLPKTSRPELNPNDLKIATIGNGEGVEHVLRRQLEMSPEKFGFDGDIGDKTAIHEWSGGKAHLIAIDQGYIKGGTESWVQDMGETGPKGNPAYVLDIDASGKPSIQEYFEGKPSGTGGVNSPYEYSHNTSTTTRYTSALDSIPEEYGGVTTDNSVETGSGQEILNQIDKTQEAVSGDHTNIIEYGDNTGTGPDIENNSIDTGEKTLIENNKVKPNFENVEEHGQDVYIKNIKHLFPSGDWLEKGGLSARDVLKAENPGQLTGLNTYLHKLQEVTGLKPKEGSFFQSSETVHKYVNRALHKAGEMGKLEDLRLK
ncbi:TPA: hypothetical protein DD445_01820 [Candidatus Nomurabacteria bacterium]|nr:hypothetical protein [Candidatus Nomurabacteria bacterium]HBP27510.1 hypothetical protein [Candidatus Nomurabacteria bacterium]HBR66233.1 hypothetical protein [Candidatus Nomurabacteria bacterium]HCU47190.1 hypothetical protein [Candidatus Nomurabacteria bacterium]